MSLIHKLHAHPKQILDFYNMGAFGLETLKQIEIRDARILHEVSISPKKDYELKRRLKAINKKFEQWKTVKNSKRRPGLLLEEV